VIPFQSRQGTLGCGGGRWRPSVRLPSPSDQREGTSCPDRNRAQRNGLPALTTRGLGESPRQVLNPPRIVSARERRVRVSSADAPQSSPSLIRAAPSASHRRDLVLRSVGGEDDSRETPSRAAARAARQSIIQRTPGGDQGLRQRVRSRARRSLGRAYEISQRENAASDEENWLQAERELQAERGTVPATPKRKRAVKTPQTCSRAGRRYER
jgi:hypothetical protein